MVNLNPLKCRVCAGLFAVIAHTLLAYAQLTTHTVATDIRGGYQVLAADLNQDGKPDLIALGSQMDELVWFENPGWQRHVLTNRAPHMINLDAADIDGDGIPEIALAYEFNVSPGRSPGKLGILHHNGDPRGPWDLKEFDAIPTSHRVRWADIEGTGKKVLIDAPILNAKAKGFPDPDRFPTPLVYYRPGIWKREIISEQNRGVVHGLFIWTGNNNGRDSILTAGRLGIFLHSLGKDGVWLRSEIVGGEPAEYPEGGASDVAVGSIKGKTLMVSIEPFHGNKVVTYMQDSHGQWQRNIIDTELSNGHSLLVVDIDGDSVSEIIAGGTHGTKNVYLYKAKDAEGKNWVRGVLDDEIAANSCVAADLNGDGRIDIACIDNTPPFSLKWYENLGTLGKSTPH